MRVRVRGSAHRVGLALRVVVIKIETVNGDLVTRLGLWLWLGVGLWLGSGLQAIFEMETLFAGEEGMRHPNSNPNPNSNPTLTLT